MKPEDVGRYKVVRKCYGSCFFQHLDLVNRYRMIWIINGKAPRTTIRTVTLDRLSIFVP